jgi:CBS domain-containing protein
MTQCSDVMTPDPVSCAPTDSISRAAEIMKRENVGSVPVVDADASRRLVGIVTDRDIVVKVVAGGTNIASATVRDAMTADPATCRENEDVNVAVSRMSEHQVRRMPVVDTDGRLRGIIAQADIATRVQRDRTTGDMVEAISEPGSSR